MCFIPLVYLFALLLLLELSWNNLYVKFKSETCLLCIAQLGRVNAWLSPRSSTRRVLIKQIGDASRKQRQLELFRHTIPLESRFLKLSSRPTNELIKGSPFPSHGQRFQRSVSHTTHQGTIYMPKELRQKRHSL